VLLFASCSIVDLNDIKEKAYEHMDLRLNGTWVAPTYNWERINFSYGNVKVYELDSSGINYILAYIGTYTTSKNSSITVMYNQVHGSELAKAFPGPFDNRLYTKAELEKMYPSADSLLTFPGTYSVTNNVFTLNNLSLGVIVSYNKM